ncbi:hypothetical protein ABL78_5576 [Leptomonas seymouri]|uniref:Sfi1 spindle body domain-containing protein n=1 Tax=Leptomonas seymouri TaxID=5684 RepID=A0A0N1HUY9_LEPSE|nr:hypothetical protein ABL78_5576 [Leptomonas seymouri]|eukprot:KPI85352.1 hypothetical protein ABL78_5576 [Leptomonas seymouri]
MRRYPVRIRNFYDDEDDDDVENVQATAVTQQIDEAEPLPQAFIPIQPAARSPSRTAPRGVARQHIISLPYKEHSGSDSSASIEDVIPWGIPSCHADALIRADDCNLPTDEYLSLRQLEESVEQSKRDIKRLRALMVRAVWHALTQPSAEKQGSSKNTLHKCPASSTAVASSTAQRGKVRDDTHTSRSAAATTASATLPSDVTGFFNERPFLPPDRHPTLPPLTEIRDHFHVDLSRAVFAAQRAGLFEKQRAWLHQREASLGAAAPVPENGVAPLPGSSSVRQTALQRVSVLSTAATSSSLPGQRTVSRVHAAKLASYDDAAKEELIHSSLSLVVLRVAKDRAVATLFLRQLRLDVYRRQLLRENVALRYTYYLQRRVLRNWCACAARQHAWRTQILWQAVTKWQLYMQHHRALHERLRSWRQQVHQRAVAFIACERARLMRYWHQWTRTFTWRRERSGLYEAAAQFAQSHRGPALFGLNGDAYRQEARNELVALLHGAPLTAKDGDVVATPVGHRLALQRLFQAWKRKAERRLMEHLAVWHRVQCLRRRVVRVLCARVRVLALRAHRQRNEARRLASAATIEDDLGGTATALAHQQRAPMRVFAISAPRHELLKYKAGAASCITHAFLLRQCFVRWRTRLQKRCANLFRRQCMYLHVMRRWLHALTVHQQQKEWKVLVMARWVVAVRHRRDAAAAARLSMYAVLNRAFHMWRTHFMLRVARAGQRLRGCFDRWRERAALRAGVCTLRRVMLHRLLWRWHLRAQARVNTRANLYVAGTLFETGLLLGSVRRWRFRAREHHRVRLAWEVFAQLSHERLCRRCFAVWQRRTFGPAAAPLCSRPSGTVSSPAASLLV